MFQYNDYDVVFAEVSRMRNIMHPKVDDGILTSL